MIIINKIIIIHIIRVQFVGVVSDFILSLAGSLIKLTIQHELRTKMECKHTNLSAQMD